MKRIILSTLTACLLCITVAGRSYVYGVVGGTPTISMYAVPAGLQPGDTLLIPGVYDALSFKGLKGTRAQPICILGLPGHAISTPADFAAGEMSDCEFVVFEALNFRNFAGIAHWFRVRDHDLAFRRCRYVNDKGRYPNKQAFYFDDKYSQAMVFDGTKATTFYNIQVTDCTFDGFRETFIMELGGDTKRSICLDFTIEHNVFKNVVNYVHVPAGVMTGTVFGIQFHNNQVDSIMAEAGSYQGVHVGSLNLYGNGDVGMNLFEHSYSNDLRWVPLKFLGLPGYDGPLRVHDNISHAKLSYSFVEASMNNAGPRLQQIPCDTARVWVYHNTVVNTSRASYNGDYFGFVADVYMPHVSVRYNVIANPEGDRPWDARRGYVTSLPQGPQKDLDTVGNRVYRTPWDARIDTATWTLATGSPLVDQLPVSPDSADFHGAVRPQGLSYDLGAIEQTGGARKLLNVGTRAEGGLTVVYLYWSDGTTTKIF